MLCISCYFLRLKADKDLVKEVYSAAKRLKMERVKQVCFNNTINANQLLKLAEKTSRELKPMNLFG